MVVLLHKPAGVVTTASDPQGRPTVVDLVPAPVRLFPVGRLDRETTGRAAPDQRRRPGRPADAPAPRRAEDLRRHAWPPTRRRRCSRRLREGVRARRRPDRPGRRCGWPGTGRVEITIHEGRNRQVRRMLAAVGHPARALHRSALRRPRARRPRPGRVARARPTPRWRRCGVHDAVVVGARPLRPHRRPPPGGRRRGRGRARGGRPGRRAGVDAGGRRHPLRGRRRGGRPRQHRAARASPTRSGAELRRSEVGWGDHGPVPVAWHVAGRRVRAGRRARTCASAAELERLGARPRTGRGRRSRSTSGCAPRAPTRTSGRCARRPIVGDRLDGAAAGDVAAGAGGASTPPGAAPATARSCASATARAGSPSASPPAWASACGSAAGSAAVRRARRRRRRSMRRARRRCRAAGRWSPCRCTPAPGSAACGRTPVGRYGVAVKSLLVLAADLPAGAPAAVVTDTAIGYAYRHGPRTLGSFVGSTPAAWLLRQPRGGRPTARWPRRCGRCFGARAGAGRAGAPTRAAT